MAWIGLAFSALAQVNQGLGELKASTEQAKLYGEQKVRQKYADINEEKAFRDREKRLLATGNVTLASQGTTDEGSPLMIAANLAGQIEEEAMIIRHGGELTQRRMGQQIEQIRSTGERSASAAQVRAGGSLLQGAGSAYGGMSKGGGYSNPTSLSGAGYTSDSAGNRVRVA